jgi:hypothetical protein
LPTCPAFLLKTSTFLPEFSASFAGSSRLFAALSGFFAANSALFASPVRPFRQGGGAAGKAARGLCRTSVVEKEQQEGKKKQPGGIFPAPTPYHLFPEKYLAVAELFVYLHPQNRR